MLIFKEIVFLGQRDVIKMREVKTGDEFVRKQKKSKEKEVVCWYYGAEKKD